MVSGATRGGRPELQTINSAQPALTGAGRSFRVTRPLCLEEALERKSAAGSRGRFWAGGTDIMLDWRRGLQRFTECIDLSLVDELVGIRVLDDQIIVGARTTLHELAGAAGQSEELRVLAGVAAVMCTVQTRTIATIGGNLANASPAADLAPPLLALDATAVVVSQRGTRELALVQLFAGPKRTSLEEDELLGHVMIPRARGRGAAYQRIARTHVDIALALSAVSVEVDAHGIVVGARLGMGSVAPTPLLVDLGPLLVGRPVGAAEGSLDAAGSLAAAAAAPIDDVRTTAAYRTEMCKVLTRRALQEAAGRAGAAR